MEVLDNSFAVHSSVDEEHKDLLPTILGGLALEWHRATKNEVEKWPKSLTWNEGKELMAERFTTKFDFWNTITFVWVQ